MSKKVINSEKAPAPIGPYNQAVLANGFLFISGQIPIIPGTGELETGGIEKETHRVMKNLQEVLSAAGMHFGHVVKTSIFLSDMTLFSKVNDVYGGYFSGDHPARESIAVNGLPKDVQVEISMIAVEKL